MIERVIEDYDLGDGETIKEAVYYGSVTGVDNEFDGFKVQAHGDNSDGVRLSIHGAFDPYEMDEVKDTHYGSDEAVINHLRLTPKDLKKIGSMLLEMSDVMRKNKAKDNRLNTLGDV